MIRTEHLSKRFGKLLAVDDLSLEVERGEVFGFLGPNGAGKTTTMRMLAALIAPTSGAAWINGKRVGQDNEAVRASVGLLTETPGLYPRLNAEENLAFFARLHGVQDIAGQVQKYLSLLGLWERRAEAVGGFSKGMQQKLAIARALLHEPPVLFLDEPTSALDPEAARVVRDFIATLKGEGRTIFICTHNLDEADRLCDRVAVIKQRLIRVDAPETLRQGLYGRSVRVRLREKAPGLIPLVRELPFVTEVVETAEGLRVALNEPESHNPELIQALVAAGAAIQFVERESHSLEQVYFDLLRESETEA
ncbi:MAG: ABC transporter ATP-binding protein [Anaerolineae bacterium]|jgi:ABC-2 type transport system ATP-binding protein|nr:ABC transporter ATP-binding protein [Anaerolineae bacterium]